MGVYMVLMLYVPCVGTCRWVEVPASSTVGNVPAHTINVPELTWSRLQVTFLHLTSPGKDQTFFQRGEKSWKYQRILTICP